MLWGCWIHCWEMDENIVLLGEGAKRQQQRYCRPVVALSFNFMVAVGIIMANKLVGTIWYNCCWKVMGRIGFNIPIFLTFVHCITARMHSPCNFIIFVPGVLWLFALSLLFFSMKGRPNVRRYNWFFFVQSTIYMPSKVNKGTYKNWSITRSDIYLWQSTIYMPSKVMMLS